MKNQRKCSENTFGSRGTLEKKSELLYSCTVDADGRQINMVFSKFDDSEYNGAIIWSERHRVNGCGGGSASAHQPSKPMQSFVGKALEEARIGCLFVLFFQFHVVVFLLYSLIAIILRGMSGASRLRKLYRMSD